MRNQKDLVTIQEAKVVTSSLQVSQTFSKEHRNVVRDIENLKKDVLNFEQMFVESSYLDSYNRKQRMYVINRDGFTLLAMGFTGKKALQFKLEYINAFNRMEEYIKRQTNTSLPLPSPTRKYNRQKIDTYVSVEEHERLKLLSGLYGFSSTYQLLQHLIRNFIHGNDINYIDSLLSSSQKTIEQLSQLLEIQNKAFNHTQTQADYYKERYQDRCNFVEEVLPMMQEMNQTISEERALRKQAEQKLKRLQAILQ